MYARYPTLILVPVHLGCNPEVQSATDGSRYLTALETEDAQDAAASCESIANNVLRGDCLLHLALDQARTGENGQEFCNRIDHDGWQQACFFELADMAGLWGEEAVEACSRTPDFRDRCLSHAIVRHAGRVANRYPRGEEDRFLEWILETASFYGLEDVSHVTSDVLAQHIGSHACDGTPEGETCPPFSVEMCGSASEEICRQAYRVTVRSAVRSRDIESICRHPLNREALSQSGFPVWVDEFSEPAIETWGHICQAITGSTPPAGPPVRAQP